uniref:HD domain-containing protein n=1 Tax=uncultured Altererythrobacter sp. TaxID=500840 RepID=UPI0026154B8D|nr:HD domain-containing protein [uncultured Altererythrobacter sp.]
MRARAATKQRIKNDVKFRYREVDEILPPDSAIALEALAMCEEFSDPYLLNHCLRAYFWARLLDDGAQAFDDEALFSAIMLHDMGLTDAHRLKGDEQQCFTVVGARMIQDLARKHLWPDARATLAANAVTLHLNVMVDAAHGREAELVRAGSGADVAGLGLDVLHADQVAAVCKKHPRQGFKPNMLDTMDIEASCRPKCRVAFMNKSLGFDKLIAGTTVFED